MEELFGFVARSAIKHAVVGVFTSGLGNTGLLLEDIRGLLELADGIDTITSVGSSVSSSSGDVLFWRYVCYIDDGSANETNVHIANGNDGAYPQGTDRWGKPVAYTPAGTPYGPNGPSQTYSPNEVVPPSPTTTKPPTAPK